MGLSPTAGIGGAGISSESLAGIGGIGVSKGPSVIPYVGPLDLVPGVIIAGSATRALTRDYLGDVNYTLRRSEGEPADETFSNDATTGLIDNAAIITWKGEAETVQVAELNDHSGHSYTLTETEQALPEWGVSGDLAVIGPYTVSNFSRLANATVNMPAGAITLGFVLEVQTDGVLIFRAGDGSGTAQINIATFYNVENDVAVTIKSAGGSTFVDWVTEGVLIPETRTFLVVTIAADGTVTVTADGQNLNAQIEVGVLTPYPGLNPSSVLISLDGVPSKLYEFYVWPGVVDLSGASPAGQDINAFYNL